MAPKSSHFTTVGQTYHDFTVTDICNIDELHCQLIQLKHLPTGAHVMHIVADDPENVFCLSFQTIPTKSDGVAHILEHTVLCGSEKYPVKDPFFAMQGRSLNTFMNAFTGPDFTCYPAASQVPKDFYNLLEVYLDAVFHPNLNELSFLQEGHRLEFTVPDDPATPLENKGIVFNEMKGALTSSSSRLNETISKALFPDLTYGINSGGDPVEITKLTYQELRDFHRTYYHPSRCLFFFYGNIPLERHLDFLAEKILKEVKHPLPPLPALPLQRRFTHPRKITDYYPTSEEKDLEDKAIIAVGWLTCHILEQEELLALNILELILLDTDASPLKMALMKSGFCKQVSSYIETETSEIPWIITLKGCHAEDTDNIDKVIRTTLQRIIKEGIPLSHVENAIHQLEFYRSEITGDHTPFGLSLFMRSGLLLQHGGKPEDGLIIHALFDTIRKRNLHDPTYLTGLIKKYLLDNPHCVRVDLLPDQKLGAKEHNAELTALKVVQESLTDRQKQHLVEQAKRLKEFQELQEDKNLDILPKVTIEDIPKTSRQLPLTKDTAKNLVVYHHACFTNEIVYADLFLNLPNIAEHDLPYLRLMTTLMSQMGCAGRSYAENLEYIQANTGGVASSVLLNIQASDHKVYTPELSIRGKALHRKAPRLFTLLAEMTMSVDFSDKERLKEILLKQYTGLQSTLSQSSLKYAINIAGAGLDEPGKISSLMYGLDYFHMIKDLALQFHEKGDWLVAKLQELQKRILHTGTPDMVITSDAAIFDEIKRHNYYGLDDLALQPYDPWVGKFPLTPCHSQGRIIASPVSFTTRVMKTVGYTHPDAAALNIAASIFDNTCLHAALREQGSAYGGGAVSNSMGANFYFYSYRDPNIVSTLDAFDTSVKMIVDGKFDEDDLNEAKLEMAQGLDSPIAPGSRGDLAYGWMKEGKTLEVRQNFRNSVLALTRKGVIKAVKEHIAPKMASAPCVVFGGKELLEKENGKLIAAHKAPLKILEV